MASEDIQPSDFTDHNLGVQFYNHAFLRILVLFLSLLLLLIFTFFHFVRHRYDYLTINIGATTLASAMGARSVVLPRQPRESVGLDAATINSLPIFMHCSLEECSDVSSSTVVRERECSICLGLFEDEELIKVLPQCLHAYHSECIDRWLSTQSSCPLCRSFLDSSSNYASATT